MLRQNVVYFILNPRTNLLKIGTTGDIGKRLSNIRTCIPDAILLGVVKGGKTLEFSYHHQWRHLRTWMGREWFDHTPDLKTWVINLLKEAQEDKKAERKAKVKQRRLTTPNTVIIAEQSKVIQKRSWCSLWFGLMWRILLPILIIWCVSKC